MKQSSQDVETFFLQKKGLKTRISPKVFPNVTTVFESMRTYEGHIFLLSEHLERLQRSANTIGLSLPATREELFGFVLDSFKTSQKKEAFLRLTVAADAVWLFVAPAKTYPSDIYQKGVRVAFSAVRRNVSMSAFPEAKSSSYLNGVLARIENQEAHEILYLDAGGYAAEGLISNLFVVRDGALQTPFATGILNGLTRDFVIKLALSMGIPVHETRLTRHDIYNAEEAFLTYSSGELVPIREVDGRQIGTHCPGTMTSQLHQRFGDEVKKIIRQPK